MEFPLQSLQHIYSHIPSKRDCWHVIDSAAKETTQTIRKSQKNTHTQEQEQIGQKNLNHKPQTGQKLTQFAPRMCGSLILCLIVVYLGLVKVISHTKSIKRVCPLSQQSDVEFARNVDN